MAEVGLVRFAQVALEVASAILPRYRTNFSKHQFTQPQLLVILCLMRYEDWTFREAEVRLGEHGELRRALKLRSIPDHTTLYRFLLRLEETAIAAALEEVVRRMKLPRRQRRIPVAIDATGLSPGAVSSFFVRRLQDHHKRTRSYTHWLKWLVVVDLQRQLVLAQKAEIGPANVGARLPQLIDAAHAVHPVGLVLADAEFDSERNHRHIRQRLGAYSVIPAKRGHPSWRIHGIRARMRHHFPQRLYRQRALVETVFSTTKRKLSCRAPGRSLHNKCHQALLLGLTYNLYRL